MKVENDFFHEVSFLYSTCKNYEFLWNTFFSLLNTHSSLMNLPLFSNTKDDFVMCGHEIKGNGVDNKLDFSTRTFYTLKKIESKYIIFCLDDFFFLNDIDLNYILNAYATIKNNKKIGCVILHDIVKPFTCCSKKYNDEWFIVKRNYKWRINTQIAVWDKKYLFKILRKGENAWLFEENGSFRSKYYKNIILFPNENNNKKIQYEDGGVVHKGEISNLGLKMLNKYDSNITYQKNIRASNNTISLLNRKIRSFYRICYKPLSIYLRNIRYK